MSHDERVRAALHAEAGDMVVDPVAALAAVTREAAVRDRRQRWAVGSVVIAAVSLVVALTVWWRADSSPEPAPATTRPSVTSTSIGAPYKITRTLTATSLGMRGLLAVAAAPDGTMYATDSSQQVVHLDANGAVLDAWGRPGGGDGQFRMEVGAIAVGRDGKVYVVDTGNFRVQVFSPRGEFLAAYGSFGEGTAQFLWPFDVAVDNAGAVYVTDDRAKSLTKFSPTGKQEWRVGGSGRPPSSGMAGHLHLSQFDDRGLLVAANDDKGLVLRVSPTGQDVASVGPLGVAGGGQPTTSGPFNNGVCDATVDSRGRIHVASCEDAGARSRTVTVADSSGQPVAVWNGCPLTRAPVFGPRGLVLGVTHDGSLAFLEPTF